MKKIILPLLAAALSFAVHAQDLVVIASPNLHCNDSVLVFVPQHAASCAAACCDDTTPALFLLHGWSGSYDNWATKCDLQAVADASGFIIICPDGFYDSWYVNANDPDKMQWRDFFDRELYPEMMERYRLDPEKTFITGLSMGGHGAINIFLDDVTRFRAAGSMSGVLDLAYEAGRLGLNERIGPRVPENTRHAEESAVNRVERAGGTGKPMLISCGYDDRLLEASRSFCEKCREAGVPHFEIYSPGTHSWIYWDYALRLHLWYFSRILKGENLGYPVAIGNP